MSDRNDPIDVLIVGGGVAGFVAARAARQGENKVVLVSRGGGSTSQWSGAVDLADDLHDVTPGAHVDGLARGGSLDEAIGRLVARRPRHPFAHADHPASALVDDALNAVVAAAPGVHFARRADDQNHVLATALGTVKRAALVPASQHLDIADLDDTAVVGLVDWQDLAGFGAAPAAALLGYLANLGGKPAPRFVTVTVPRFSAEVFRDATYMARALDHTATRERACLALRRAAEAATTTASTSTPPRAPTHLLSPAIFGTAPLDAAAVLALDAAVGRPLRELLSTPPSVPAARLATALRDQARVDGIELVDGAAERPLIEGGALTSIDVVGAFGRRTLTTKALVLCTGRFFGGGLARDPVARETICGFPVVSEGRVVGDAFIGDLVAEHVEGEHAIFRAGVAVDTQWRPLDERGRPIARNVFAGGLLVGGYDPARDGGALGVAAWTARQAGRQARTAGMEDAR
jgi:glycerol-3-phosphate dehydrogenase subunit B